MEIKSQSISETTVRTIEDLLIIYPKFREIVLQNGVFFKAEGRHIISPKLQLATSTDASEITNTFKEVYKGTYPYKQMEDINEVQKMIESEDSHWLLFKDHLDKIMGCVGFQIDLINKDGRFFGFALRKEYQGKFDIIKVMIAGLASILSQYKDKILYWTCEARTAHNKAQYLTQIMGLSPIAFLPNKDIFFNREESEILYIIYDQKALKKSRNKNTPKIIREVVFSYSYSAQKYELGLPKIINPSISYKEAEINRIKKLITLDKESDRLGNENFILSIKNRDSRLAFLHNSNIHMIEKADYKVEESIELRALIEKIKEIISLLEIRYFEISVSAYNPEHQKILYNAGFKPVGYIPSRKFNTEKNVFDDQVIFIFTKNQINKNIKLVKETKEFLKSLNFYRKIHNEELFLFE
ncbi:MAG: hypothetical protein EU542_01705 [Promethearchaeota archaeon]|nr:MAG: hypothetical protein EU542_01705 [Candidatus Lokiarchaeota archaeon]